MPTRGRLSSPIRSTADGARRARFLHTRTTLSTEYGRLSTTGGPKHRRKKLGEQSERWHEQAPAWSWLGRAKHRSERARMPVSEERSDNDARAPTEPAP